MAEAQEPAQLVAGLGHSLHLEREKALKKLTAELEAPGATHTEEFWAALEAQTRKLLVADKWESRLGGLNALSLFWRLDTPLRESAEVYTLAISAALSHLEDEEVRVRQAVGECLFTLAAHAGPKVYEECGPTIRKSIYANFERDGPDDRGQAGDGKSAGATDLLGSLLQTTYKQEVPGEGSLRHHTEGWKCLETSCKALKRLMEGLGTAMAVYVDQELLDLIYRCFVHQNRFVRETGYFAIAAVCQVTTGEPLIAIADQMAEKLHYGLSDNWSQVRFAASTACRAYMQALPENERTPRFALLVPPMCLNRYYVAAGVRLYSQETWKLVMKEEGKKYVAQFAKEVVEYYIEQSKANNHAVREAACACIAELMEKVDSNAVRPHITPLLKALVDCFKDESWPVRDASCTACGRCIMAFPEESRAILNELYELWFAHLWDNIWSVRENSAMALANVIRAYGDEAKARILPKVDEMIMQAKEQPEESGQYSGLENTTLFGVAARRQRDNDVALHTDQTMFSCGSLAPKLKRGGGCMDHGFSRDKEPWEASDGACYMVRELSAVCPEAVAKYLPQMADLMAMRHFTHALNLHETVCKCLPTIARNMGKRPFKAHLELFIEPLFKALVCEHQLTEAAAGNAIGRLRDLVGPNIWAGRLNDEQNALMSNHNIPPAGPPGGGSMGAVRGAGPVTFPSGVGVGTTPVWGAMSSTLPPGIGVGIPTGAGPLTTAGMPGTRMPAPPMGSTPPS